MMLLPHPSFARLCMSSLGEPVVPIGGPTAPSACPDKWIVNGNQSKPVSNVCARLWGPNWSQCSHLEKTARQDFAKKVLASLKSEIMYNPMDKGAKPLHFEGAGVKKFETVVRAVMDRHGLVVRESDKPQASAGGAAHRTSQFKMFDELPAEILIKILESVILESELDPLKTVAALASGVRRGGMLPRPTENTFETFNQILGLYGEFGSLKKLPEHENAGSAQKWFEYASSQKHHPKWLRAAIRNVLVRSKIFSQIEGYRKRVKEAIADAVKMEEVDDEDGVELLFLMQMDIFHGVVNGGQMVNMGYDKLLVSAFEEAGGGSHGLSSFYAFSQKTYELISLLGKGAAAGDEKIVELVLSCARLYYNTLKVEGNFAYDRHSEAWSVMRLILQTMLQLTTMRGYTWEIGYDQADTNDDVMGFMGYMRNSRPKNTPQDSDDSSEEEGNGDADSEYGPLAPEKSPV